MLDSYVNLEVYRCWGGGSSEVPGSRQAARPRHRATCAHTGCIAFGHERYCLLGQRSYDTLADGVELVASQLVSACDVQHVIAADGDLVELLLDVADVARDIMAVDIASSP